MPITNAGFRPPASALRLTAAAFLAAALALLWADMALAHAVTLGDEG